MIPIATLSLLAATLAAHDLYIMPSSFQASTGEKITIAIHNGDSFPDSEISPVIARLKDVTVHCGKHQYNVTNLREDGARAIGDGQIHSGGVAVVSARTTPHLLEQTAPDFEKYLKSEGLVETIAWRKDHGESAKPGKERYSKFAKSLVDAGGGDLWSKPIGHGLEIIPEKNPFSLHSGGRLRVQVLWHGKPAAGLNIEASYAGPEGGTSFQAGRTDQQGKLFVFLKSAGKWRLHTVGMERCAEPAVADWESSWASLTFEIR